MVAASEAMKPPRLAKDLLNVPMIRSTFSLNPKWLVVPAPFLPKTPIEWASSTITAAPYSAAMRQSSGKGIMSPSILKTPSTTMSLPASGSSFCRRHSSAAMSRWAKRMNLPCASRHPSTMLAWLLLSPRTYSPLPTSALMTPRLTWKPVLYKRTASLLTNLASIVSNSR